MTVSRVTTWSPGNTLTADALNGEFDNVLTNLNLALTPTPTGALTARSLSARFAEVFNLKDFGCVGDGVTDDATALGLALTAAAAAGGTIYAPAGTYAYATSPNFARAGVNIYADRQAIFKHTGTGNAFSLDGGAAGSGILGNRYDNIVVQGNSSSTNGFYVRSLHHSTFINCRCLGAATTGAGFKLEWCVANTWVNPIVSSNTGTLSPIPKYGMHLSRRSGTDHSTTQTVITPIFEGLTQTNGAGIYIDYAAKNEFIGGTSESNTNGLIVTADSGVGNNAFRGMFMESNSSTDITLDGALYQSFYDCTIAGAMSITNNAGYCRFYGGVYDDTTISSDSDYMRFRDVIFASGSTLTDNSETTLYYDCVGAGGTLITNRSKNTYVATADLPAAGVAQDGKMIIEETGANSCNLVLYKGGERFKVALTES